MEEERVIGEEERKTTEFFNRILNDIPWYRRIYWNVKMFCELMWWDLHSDDYRNESFVIKNLLKFWFFGFRPIMILDYSGEDTFIFETDEEAHKAFEFFERGKPVPETGIEENDEDVPFRGWMCGWWYGKDNFEQEIKEDAIINGRDYSLYYILRWEKYGHRSNVKISYGEKPLRE